MCLYLLHNDIKNKINIPRYRKNKITAIQAEKLLAARIIQFPSGNPPNKQTISNNKNEG